MAGIAEWVKRLRGTSGVTGVLKLQPGVATPPARSGKSPFGDVVAKAVAACGAEPGNIVEVDEQGAVRVVGRRPHLAGEKGDISEQAIRARLGEIYGNDVPSVVDVTTGANVVIFRNSKRA
jgi:hypothetical protein